MPSSSIRQFADPEDYSAWVRATSLELTLTARGSFAGRLIRVDLNDLWLQHFSESLPQIAHSSIIPGRAVISFLTEPCHGFVWRGHEVQPSQIMRHSASEYAYRRTSDALSRGAMSLPIEVAALAGGSIANASLAPPRESQVLTPAPAALERLRRLHATVCHLAEHAPELIANPGCARALEQTLIEVWTGCLSDEDNGEERATLRRHDQIMRRFYRMMDENPDQAVYIPELCKAIGVSERTLRICCQEQLGVSPKRYLVWRRMLLARRALRRGTPGDCTVTEIATQCGFWELGRFAAEYRLLFGETPSATLRRK